MKLIRFALVLSSLLFAPLSALAQPNIILIMTDDQEIQSMEYMPKTKALLADKGITFTNSFVHFSQCCPSRANWLSGQYSHNNGVLGNTPMFGGGYQAWKPTEGNSLPVWLHTAGYHTGLTGKYLNYYENEANHVPPGWTWWRGLKSRPDYYGWTVYAPNYPGSFFTPPVTSSYYLTDDQKTRAVNFVTTNPTPQFLWVSLYGPHAASPGTPIPAPRHDGTFDNLIMKRNPSFNTGHMTGKHPIVASYPVRTPAQVAAVETYWRRYIETLQSVDDLVESVVNGLASAGRLNNTYIIFTSDNGYMMGDHRWMGKVLPYERSIRVPLIIRGPGIPEGQTRDQLVTNVDVVATIVDLASATPLRVLDGRSLVPLFSGAPYAWRSAVSLTGIYDPGQLYETNLTRWNAVRTMTRKYIRASDGHEELYDIEADPWERFSVVNDPYYANDLNVLRGLETTLKSCSGSSCWVP